jgi:hypothetical protein
VLESRIWNLRVYFLGSWFWLFCGGFGKKRVVERGFLMVNLWWIRGESWLIDGPISGLKNIPRIVDLFFLFALWDSSNCIDAFGKGA